MTSVSAHSSRRVLRRRRLAVAFVLASLFLVLLLLKRWLPASGQPDGPEITKQAPEPATSVVQVFPAQDAGPTRGFTNRPFGPPELRVLVRDENDQPIPRASAKASWPADPRPGYVVIGGPSFR